EADAITDHLIWRLPWQQREVLIHGRRVLQPRLIVYQAADPRLSYTYSRVKLNPEPWDAVVLAVKERVEACLGTSFNSCLLNYYRDGKDKMSWHSDNEPLYGSEPTIASVSFGAARDFILRSNEDHACKRTYSLGQGTLLVMGGSTQDHWMHAVPPRARVEEPRINLTFRQIIRQP
ncbi:hypothetical protein APUTEX25_001559, partial [Auxenochlorella protothecoides]